MKNKSIAYKIGVFIVLAVAVVLWILVLSKMLPTSWWPNWTFALLDPKGIIASQQKWLMINATLIMLTLAIPAYFMLFFFAHKYNAKNNLEQPVSTPNNKLALLIWGGPITVIFFISILILQSTPELDPYKPIITDKKPLTVQVVALRWKWLFIYPEQNIATVNFLQIPEDTPINFELTADGPMNTFWIPQLGGQIYAMTGMETKLHLLASEQGEFNGRSSEINGAGFSGMKFVTKATSQTDFESWVQSVKNSNENLDREQYTELLKPTENNLPKYFSMVDESLYDSIIMKYMTPMESAQNTYGKHSSNGEH